ncbi:MAG TPA: NAD(P)H-hydrate epimerase, partial [Bacteroidales bacterium]|nr:NAD(P)H-hydrate epimerase [Bacteroidales bacterium]
MKIFLTSQIREIDRLTIEGEPISSINLMERAALSIFGWFACNISSKSKVVVFAGHGNNGGDGLALGRLLNEVGYCVDVYLLGSNTLSPDCQINYERLNRQGITKIRLIKSEKDFPNLNEDCIVVDSLFGSGLTRPIEGVAAQLIDHINGCKAKVISIDIPSGLFGEGNPFPNNNPVVKASITLTLQFPKQSFFFAENYRFVGDFEVLPIGLSPKAIDSTISNYHYVTIDDLRTRYKPRDKFNHKGVFGHALIVSGSKGMMGAAILASRASIKTGCGLVTTHIPQIGYAILQKAVPEVLVDLDIEENCFSALDSISKYQAIAIGPGLGKSVKSVEGLSNILNNTSIPLVIDADGLNILADNRELLAKLPKQTIITPHPREFERLFGTTNSGYERLQRAIEASLKY